MRVVVLGGAGCIGRALCRRLSHVVVVDNLSSSTRPSDLRFIEADVRDPSLWDKLPWVPTEIYHLASPASVKHYQSNPIKTIKVIIEGVLNVLKYCKRHPSVKLVVASTSEVYGDPLECPQSETYWGHVNPIGVRACYDEAKRLMETLVVEYRRKYGLDLKIVRIFNTYGWTSWDDDDRFIPTLIRCIQRDEPMPVYGGNQYRSFCYVDDLVEGLMCVMASNELGPVNLGNPHERYTVDEVIQIAEELMGRKIPVIRGPLLEDDPHRRCPDIRLAESLGFHPTVSLREGLSILLADKL